MKYNKIMNIVMIVFSVIAVALGLLVVTSVLAIDPKILPFPKELVGGVLLVLGVITIALVFIESKIRK